MPATATVYDARKCQLGEGPLWHPDRATLFWFDIEGKALLGRKGDTALKWDFDRAVSAAGLVDETRLLIASETGLSIFDLESGDETSLCAIEADNPETRSNDGRADPWGGFWMGTMSKAGAPSKGTLYRWYRGTLRALERGVSTPNALCFDQERLRAYFADTKERMIWKYDLDPDTGWPVGSKDVFLDLNATEHSPEYRPDGAVVDKEGCLWNAQWGAGRVARYGPDGAFLGAVAVPTGHSSCPAFGGAEYTTLFITTAQHKLPPEPQEWHETAGQVFSVELDIAGRPEPRVIV